MEAYELRKPSPIVGVDRDSVYTVDTVTLDLRNELFVYSDGVFEITRPDGTMLRWAEFVDELRRPPRDHSKVVDVRSFCETVAGKEAFDDDFLLLHVSIVPPVGGWPGRARGWTPGANVRSSARRLPDKPTLLEPAFATETGAVIEGHRRAPRAGG